MDMRVRPLISDGTSIQVERDNLTSLSGLELIPVGDRRCLVAPAFPFRVDNLKDVTSGQKEIVRPAELDGIVVVQNSGNVRVQRQLASTSGNEKAPTDNAVERPIHWIDEML